MRIKTIILMLLTIGIASPVRAEDFISPGVGELFDFSEVIDTGEEVFVGSDKASSQDLLVEEISITGKPDQPIAENEEKPEGEDEGELSAAEYEGPVPVATSVLNGHHYALYENGYTWWEAKAICEDLGGHLITIISEEEQQTLNELLSHGSKNNYWLGGYYDGVWYWITGEAFAYSHWASYQPDNSGVENALEAYRNPNPYATSYLGEWNDLRDDGTFPGQSFFGIDEFGFVCEWEPEIASKYVIQVIDEEGNPLENAQVTYDGETKSTGADGVAQFSSFSFRNPVLKVELDGFITWSNENSNWEKSSNNLETIVLYPEKGEEIRLKKVRYSKNSIMLLSWNILTKTKKISLGSGAALTGDLDNGRFYISCEAYNPERVSEYQLWQGNTKIKSSTNGFFECNSDDFEEGGNCFIRCLSTDGDMVDVRINLTFEKAPINEATSIALDSDSFSIEIGDDVPYIGGQKIEFDLPIDIPITWKITEDSYQVGFNIAVKGGDDLDTQIRETKKLFLQMKRVSQFKLGKLDETQSRKFKALANKRNSADFFNKDSFQVNVLGYAEGDWSAAKISGELAIQVEMDLVDLEYNSWVVIVPVTVQFSVSGEGQLSASISYDLKSSTIDGSLAGTVSPGLHAFGGVGISKLASVGAYGDAVLDIALEILPRIGCESIDLTGDLGARAYLGWQTFEKSFAHNTWHLYSRNTVGAASVDSLVSSSALEFDDGIPNDEVVAEPYLEAGNDNVSSVPYLLEEQLSKGIYDASSYHMADLSYLYQEMDMMEAPLVAQSIESSDSDGMDFDTLISNVYRNAQPVMVSTGEALYLAYISANPDTGHAQVKISKYNGVSWSEGVAVDSEALMDSQPSLLVDKAGSVWLAYAQTNGTFGGSFTDFAAGQQIVVGRINPETMQLEDPHTFKGSGYTHMPQLALVGDVPTLLYVDSVITDENSVLWPDVNTICSARFINDSWSEVSVISALSNVILDMAAGAVEGRLSVACVLDSDNSHATTTDQYLYLVDGSTLNLISDKCAGVIYGVLPGTTEGTLLWTEGNNLNSLQGTLAVLDGLNGAFRIGNNGIYYCRPTESGSQLCVSKWTGNGLTPPIVVTNQSGYLENLSVANFGGKDNILALYTSVTIDSHGIEDKKDLIWMGISSSFSDVKLTLVDYEPEGMVQLDELPLTLYVTNAGDHPVNKLDLYVNGTLEETQDVWLNPGESAQIQVNVEVPEERNTYEIGVYETGIEDYYPQDNVFSLTLGYPDLALKLEGQQIGKKTSVLAYITNEGLEKSGGTMRFTTLDGEVLYEEEFEEVASDRSIVISYELNWESLETNRIDIVGTIICDGEDLYDSNNTGVINMTRNEDSGIEDISLNTPVQVTVENGEYAYFRFVPVLAGEYSFFSEGSCDTYGTLYDKEMNEIESNDDEETGSANFKIKSTLQEGETVYIGARLYDEEDADSFAVRVALENHLQATAKNGKTVFLMEAGKTIQLEVDASCDHGELSYQWLRGNRDAENEVSYLEIPDAKDSVYTEIWTGEYKYYRLDVTDSYANLQSVSFVVNDQNMVEEGTIVIEESNFPDVHFREYLAGNIDSNHDLLLEEEEILDVEEMDINYRGISSLQGIAYFTNLKELFCNRNKLVELDLSENKGLELLDCSYNQLESLDLTENERLKELNCRMNDITSLNIDNCMELLSLTCSYNSLKSITIENNNKLTTIECNTNELVELDTSSNTLLETIKCYDNGINRLNLSNNTLLQTLNCDYNQLSALDITNNTMLTYLDCESNQLTSLNTYNNPNLKTLYCDRNRIEELDLTNNMELTEVSCEYNELQYLDVSKNQYLEELYCGHNKLTSMDISTRDFGFSIACSENTLEVSALGGCFDLTTLPSFDISKASNWSGGEIDGKYLKVEESGNVTYTYDCGTIDGETCQESFELEIVYDDLSNYDVLYLPENLLTIEEEAFMGISAQAVVISEGCESIGTKAFADCRNLLYVKIPDSVVTIADDAFSGCKEEMIIDR